MHASRGDKLVIRRTGEQDRILEIVEVLGTNGEPPYRVRTQDGHEAIMSPGPDAVVEQRGRGEY
ncbi:hypothetical protein BDV39DRAFT_169927 [Aspergillus sergii]|uniref:DUF1918 domain-containing protein n=1 Tax=Aspergillus sergii TaxID=1034303 RepID=A0A5N6XGQ5_9EURO|nr:hypothetical protein BDV39DRAFT_169927 [Aspergillus sergii]